MINIYQQEEIIIAKIPDNFFNIEVEILNKILIKSGLKACKNFRMAFFINFEEWKQDNNKVINRIIN